jgi:hypothetical protein
VDCNSTYGSLVRSKAITSLRNPETAQEKIDKNFCTVLSAFVKAGLEQFPKSQFLFVFDHEDKRPLAKRDAVHERLEQSVAKEINNEARAKAQLKSPHGLTTLERQRKGALEYHRRQAHLPLPHSLPSADNSASSLVPVSLGLPILADINVCLCFFFLCFVPCTHSLPSTAHPP